MPTATVAAARASAAELESAALGGGRAAPQVLLNDYVFC